MWTARAWLILEGGDECSDVLVTDVEEEQGPERWPRRARERANATMALCESELRLIAEHLGA